MSLLSLFSILHLLGEPQFLSKPYWNLLHISDVKHLCQPTPFAYSLKEQKDWIKIKLILFKPATTRKAQCAILYYTSF